MRTVRLVALTGERIVFGGSGLVNGALDDEAVRKRAFEQLEQWQRGELAVGHAPASPRKVVKKAAGKKAA